MSDACNAPAAAQAQFVPRVIANAPCPPSFKGAITTVGSDWHDIDAVVDHLTKLKGVKQVSLVAWSQGGPRSGGYALAHPDRVKAIVALAPAYRREMPTTQPDPLPVPAAPLNVQSQADFKANWDRQAPCPGQYDPAVAASVWSEMMASDPQGASWGPGVRRAPSVPDWGFNKETVPNLKVPYLMVAGAADKQVDPSLVHNLYADIGSQQKVLIDLACASHNAMWEKPHLILFKASAEFLETGKVNGVSSGMLKLGD
jgi:pimeloyl-ACP methyl ester carboxylesterase